MDDTRDRGLGQHLEIVAEPEHGPDYWPSVREKIAVERGAGLWARLRSVFRLRSVRIAAAAAAVAAVAVAALLGGLPRTEGPQSVSARDVLKRALTAYSQGHTYQADVALEYHAVAIGVYMWQATPRYRSSRMRILRDGDGSYRLTSWSRSAGRLRLEEVRVFDAATGTLRVQDHHTWRVTTGYPLGPPDIWPGPVRPIDVGATLRAMAASGRLRLSEAAFHGRPVWTVTCTLGEMLGMPPSDVDWPVFTIAVDKQTWLPMRFRTVMAGIDILDARFRDVRIDEPLPRDAFTLRMTLGSNVKRVDRGFRRLTLAAAAGMAGVTPLVPGFVPDGYELSSVAVAGRSRTCNGDVAARHVFEMRYASGFDALTVSTRVIRHQYYRPGTDPIDNPDAVISPELGRTEYLIRSGAFAGARAKVLVATPWSTPHLWAVKDGILLTIAGGATAKELLAVADSLQVYRDSSDSSAQ